MSTPTENWPKPFLLQVHEQAVAQGMIWVKPISESDAASLKSRLYRIRRRSDSSMAAFIPPEYHLVMIGVWEPADGGRLPILYDKRSDGKPLPSIVAATGEEITTFAAPKMAEPPAPVDFANVDISIGAEEIEGIVEKLQRDAERRAAKKEGE